MKLFKSMYVLNVCVQYVCPVCPLSLMTANTLYKSAIRSAGCSCLEEIAFFYCNKHTEISRSLCFKFNLNKFKRILR